MEDEPDGCEIDTVITSGRRGVHKSRMQETCSVMFHVLEAPQSESIGANGRHREIAGTASPALAVARHKPQLHNTTTHTHTEYKYSATLLEELCRHGMMVTRVCVKLSETLEPYSGVGEVPDRDPKPFGA